MIETGDFVDMRGVFPQEVTIPVSHFEKIVIRLQRESRRSDPVYVSVHPVHENERDPSREPSR